jgi:hypothetical protein
MQINVTIADLDAIDLSTVIGNEIGWFNPETEETEYRPRTLGDLVAQRLAEKIWSATDERRQTYIAVRQARDLIIREQVKPLIEKALTGEIRLTNAFGEPAGNPTTLNALIMDEAKKVIAGSRSDYGRGQTMAQKIIADEVGATFIRELTEAMAAEKAKVVAAVRAKGAELIAEAVKQGLGQR